MLPAMVKYYYDSELKSFLFLVKYFPNIDLKNCFEIVNIFLLMITPEFIFQRLIPV